jgi:hypothetical protein
MWSDFLRIYIPFGCCDMLEWTWLVRWRDSFFMDMSSSMIMICNQAIFMGISVIHFSSGCTEGMV